MIHIIIMSAERALKSAPLRVFLKVLMTFGLFFGFIGAVNIAWLGPWSFYPDYWKPHLTYGVSTDSIVVNVRTPKPCKLELQWWIESNGTWIRQPSVNESEETEIHALYLDNLTPGISIKYRLVPMEGYDLPAYIRNDLAREFVIPGRCIRDPASASPLTFAVYGDNRPTVFGTDCHNYIVSAIVEKKPDFVINLGDLVQTGSAHMEWADYFTTGEPLLRTHPLMPTPGNHEYYKGFAFSQSNSENCTAYLDAFALPGDELFYSYNISRVHIISLDISGGNGSRNPYTQSAQEKWLEKDLASLNRSAFDWVIVFFHYPIISTTQYHYEIWDDFLGPIFWKYNISIDLFLIGHIHQYERLYLENAKAWCIISAGGGAEIDQWKSAERAPGSKVLEISHSFVTVTVDNLTLTVRAYFMKGAMFDELVLNKTVGGI